MGCRGDFGRDNDNGQIRHVRFNRLRLNGFKSFVDPTELLIADGLTGVVGPNGCGKSNLLEALRWVMGENRPTAMRGGGMEDVIFAGSGSRPARNFAEVGLWLDDVDSRAGSEFGDTGHIEVMRRITRDIGSAFKANGKDVRARDVQMLFADASTGAHSPALVRQGQISELINAKPKARRRILEEAAGIAGLYQRRHEAELKLNGAEGNLTRVDDLIEALASQLGQLARQAKAAARYRELGTAIRTSEGVLLYRRWKEASEADTAAQAELRARVTATAEAERLASEATRAHQAAEEALAPLREEAAVAGAILQRAEVERETIEARRRAAEEKIEGLTARIEQLGRDIAHEETLSHDAEAVTERLTGERTELEAAEDGHGPRLEAAREAAKSAATALQEQETEFGRQTEEVARLAARHQSAARRVEDAEVTRDKVARDLGVARDDLAGIEGVLTRATEAQAEAAKAAARTETEAEAADAALLAAEAARTQAHEREAQARGERSEAEGLANALGAEVAALGRLVERDTAEDGQVLDLLEVAPGFEKAIGAALADDLRAPLTDAANRTGWAVLAPYDTAPALPEGARPITEVVSLPDVLARRMGQIGVVEAARGAELQSALGPGQRLVSVEGDLWRWDGFRTAAEDAPSAAALRLEQLNRLVELKRDLEEASARAAGAAQAHAHLGTELARLTEGERAAREARRAADRAMADAAQALSRLEAEQNLASGRREALTLAVARLEDETGSADGALQDARAAQEELDDLDAARAAASDAMSAVEEARAAMLGRRSEADALENEAKTRSKRLAEIGREETTWANRLARTADRQRELTQRRTDAEAELASARTLPGELETEASELAEALSAGQSRLSAAETALTTGETAAREAASAERTAERTASDAREARAAAEARAEAARDAVSVAAERILESHEVAPDALLEALDVDPEAMPAADQIEADLARLRRQRDALGAVNLRAEEDAREVQDEHDHLTAEKADLESAIGKLRSGIAGLNKEGRERLLTAFEQVNENFSNLFKHLFGGGEAKLVLVESDDPLEAGLEIMCQPPGKRLATLSLLSGGEQTLTALALIFAVFLANPAPICVLDEVDAPLDDANVTRFCDLLDEMVRRTQTRFLIITHHALTMSRMDRLFGVTMAEQGVSQLVSVDLRKAEALVA